jgi:hypothetical protein
VIGTGGASLKKSAGHGTLIYAMRVDETLPRQKKGYSRGQNKEEHAEEITT